MGGTTRAAAPFDTGGLRWGMIGSDCRCSCSSGIRPNLKQFWRSSRSRREVYLWCSTISHSVGVNQSLGRSPKNDLDDKSISSQDENNSSNPNQITMIYLSIPFKTGENQPIRVKESL